VPQVVPLIDFVAFILPSSIYPETNSVVIYTSNQVWSPVVSSKCNLDSLRVQNHLKENFNLDSLRVQILPWIGQYCQLLYSQLHSFSCQLLYSCSELLRHLLWCLDSVMYLVLLLVNTIKICIYVLILQYNLT